MKRQYMTIGKWQMPSGAKPNPIEVIVTLKWIVLEKKGKRALLVARDCVEWEFFDGSNTFFEPAKSMTWEKSYLRKYLNKEFFENVFSRISMHNAYICKKCCFIFDHDCWKQ